MTTSSVNHELIQVALERATGSTFEKFVNAFYPSIGGENFVPLGGYKDGGADAFQEETIWEGDRTGTFYQASIEPDVRSKIKRTITRLKEFGRTPRRLIYLTSQPVQYIDVVEVELSKENGSDIRIRDKAYLIAHANDTPGTREAYRSYLEPLLVFLTKIGAANTVKYSSHVTSPAIYVFLRQEVERQQGSLGLVKAIADGLILWALEDTDPDREILMTERQIIQKISETIPPAAKIVRGVLHRRLEELSQGSARRERSVRFYSRRRAYCLAYEFRKVVARDNAADEALRSSVRDVFIKRIQNAEKLLTLQPIVLKAADISIAVIQKTFENQGLEFAAFLQNGQQKHQLPTISDYVDSCLDENALREAERPKLKELILNNLRGAFYDSEESERLFFSRLSATYTLLFSLNTEPRIVEYFQNMQADFHLYVGTDLLVSALSERYVPQEAQATRNALKIIRDAGGKLVLAEPVLEEVHHHLRSTDNEFISMYKPIERDVTLDLARHSDRILIRAYFYAKLTPRSRIAPPENWSAFVNQFCDPNLLETGAGREQIKDYLMSQFGMVFEDREELVRVTSRKAVAALSDQFKRVKRAPMLADNDALMALAVYGRRRKRGETSRVSEYGYRTWWLTGESNILEFTQDLIETHGAQYIMRPQFILNFLALAPSARTVRESYRTIFPSILGIRLARRVDWTELHKILDKVAEAQQLEIGRKEAKISQLADELKAFALSNR